MNTVSPFKGASVRPNTAYMRRIERYIGHKAIPIDMKSSSQSTIILNAVDRPNTAPKVVNHVLCEQGSINQKISDQKRFFWHNTEYFWWFVRLNKYGIASVVEEWQQSTN